MLHKRWFCFKLPNGMTDPHFLAGSKHFKVKEDVVIVDKIFSDAGKASSKVKVLVYSKAEEIPKEKLEKMQIKLGLKKGEDASEADQTPAPRALSEEKKDGEAEQPAKKEEPAGEAKEQKAEETKDK